jgi:hypothetical protein
MRTNELHPHFIVVEALCEGLILELDNNLGNSLMEAGPIDSITLALKFLMQPSTMLFIFCLCLKPHAPGFNKKTFHISLKIHYDDL